MTRLFSRETIIRDRFSIPFRKYRKRSIALAAKIEGPFDVATRHGITHCKNGYVALDSKDYPYPIESDEFDAIYEPIE